MISEDVGSSDRLAPAARPGRRQPAAWNHHLGSVLLVLLPPILILGGYYRPILQGRYDLPISGDAALYAYQFSRAGELGGRWWKLGDDERVGAPYQPEFGKHPGVYEGLDLILLSSLTSRWLDPVTNYHAMMMAVLAVNGWVIGWVVRRLTGSWFWAAVGVVLITWNFSTAFRLQGHAHLFKYGWTVLAGLAFARFLDRPSLRGSVALGLAMALVLQGSFYLGAFLGLAWAAWGLGGLLAGRLGRAHVRGAVAAGLVFAAAGFAMTFPVWTIARGRLLSDSYNGRGRIDAWNFSAELWQYVVSPASSHAALYVQEFNRRFHVSRGFHEGWHYPGLAVLAAVFLYLLARLRRRELPVVRPRLLDLFMGLSGLLVVLSLAGGPSFFLVPGLSCFRAYGRAGLLALALWCVTTPVILQAALRHPRLRRVRPLACLAILGLCLFEGLEATASFPFDKHIEIPAWVEWLSEQPPDVRLAAFPQAAGRPLEWWGYDSLLYRALHRHASLNGSDSLLLEADLKLLGASLDRLNPAALRFVASLGYETLAFDQARLEAQPWIRSLDWLHPVASRGGWSMFRVDRRLEQLPRAGIPQLLARLPDRETPADVPADCWITERLPGNKDCVVARSDPYRITWVDARGRRVGKPARVLFQHIFGPNLPAFSVKTPRTGGEYRLVLLDSRGEAVRRWCYRVRPDMKTLLPYPGYSGSLPDPSGLVRVMVRPDGDHASMEIVNTSQYYIQANSSREQVHLPSAQAHPGALRTSAGSLVLLAPPATGSAAALALLPCDLPPGGRIRLSCPEGCEGGEPSPEPDGWRAHLLRQDEQPGARLRAAADVAAAPGGVRR